MPTTSIVSFTMSDAEIQDVRRRIFNSLNLVRNLDERKAITNRAGLIIAERAVSIAPKSKQPHYRYLKTSSTRKTRNTGLKGRIKYNPGNLKQSIGVLESLKRAKVTYVGPGIEFKPRRKEYGPPAKVSDAYYAQMIYGSAAAFGKKIMLTAYLSVETRVLIQIERDIFRIVRKGAKINNLT